jgi:hypothetical protein
MKKLRKGTYKALSVRQPHAGRIERGEKTLEIRSRRTHFRGQLLICASANPKVGDEPTGCAVCLVDVVGCHEMTPDDAAAACVDYMPGAWAWELKNSVSVQRIPVKGQLGFYDVTVE